MEAGLNVTQLDVPEHRAGLQDWSPPVFRHESPESDLAVACEWAAVRAAELVELAGQHGAVLFRGFPLVTDCDFDQFVAAFDLPNFPYEDSLSNAVRVNRTQRVFTANEAPPDAKILLHHEMAQTPIYPSRLFFFCEKPAETGGATPLCRSDLLLERLRETRPEFVRKCSESGLKYSNVMPESSDASSGMGRSWGSTFRALNRESAETRMQQLGYSWEWLADGSLRATTPVLPAVMTLPDGRETFFNQLIAAAHGWKDVRNDPSRSITFGDGSPIDVSDVQCAVDAADDLTFDLDWQAGDVVLVDNLVAMHGRRTFTGTRKVLASLVASQAGGR